MSRNLSYDNAIARSTHRRLRGHPHGSESATIGVPWFRPSEPTVAALEALGIIQITWESGHTIQKCFATRKAVVGTLCGITAFPRTWIMMIGHTPCIFETTSA